MSKRNPNDMRYKPATGNIKIPTDDVLGSLFRDSLRRNCNNNGKALIQMAEVLRCTSAYLARKLTEAGIDYKHLQVQLFMCIKEGRKQEQYPEWWY